MPIASLSSDALLAYADRLHWDIITRERERFQIQCQQPQPYHQILNQLPSFQGEATLNENVVRIGRQDQLSTTDQELLQQGAKALMPWKKGPFELFGMEIDAEWRSDLKWSRIQSFRKSLAGRVVADIGCHNGYFMFRMAAEQPRLVVGFEPVAKHWDTFRWLNSMAQVPNLHFEGMGVEHIHAFPEFFDTVFCLGILYHHPDPIGILRKIHASMTSNAELIIDCQGIPGNESTALVPRNRYAGARGIWFLPTQSCLENWIHRAGFRQVQTFFCEALSIDEQRPTLWAPVKSLESYLDPQKPGFTTEGYPAPLRIYTRAYK